MAEFILWHLHIHNYPKFNDGDGIADSLYSDTRFPGTGMYHYFSNRALIGLFHSSRTSQMQCQDWPTTGPMTLA